MKRIVTTLAALVIVFSGLAMAQTADEEYIKAMQEADNCKKVAGLKAFLSKYSGQGSKYENFAWTYLCVTPCASKSAQESIQAGEKALALPGLDQDTRLQLMMTVASLATNSGMFDKAKESSKQIIELGKTNKASNPSEAAKWTKVQGAGYFLLGQVGEKMGDPAAASDAYIQAYQLLKDPKVAAMLKKLGKTLYDAKRYGDAEKVFRNFYAAAQDSESAVILGQTLYKGGKTDEALQIFKETYAKKKTGELAYNIAIILANKAKTNPSFKSEAINMLIEASFLNKAQSQQCLGMAQNLFLGDNKDLQANQAKIAEHAKAVDELTKTFNEKYGNKTEEDLSDSEKKTMKKLSEAITAEQDAMNKLQSEQSSVLTKFNQIVSQVKSRLGK